MKTDPKIQSSHLERNATVYIRQSSQRQVAENLESQDLQYQLVGRAQRLGWREDQVTVIDDDLGKSGASSQERFGFQSLAAEVGLNLVGIILVTDVSRLARNCADWYQLLDLASYFWVLISDASGVYDPRLYDDRLLLGLKGTFSEIQWHQMRSQLCAARMNKARRGELRIGLPVGLQRQADGSVIKTPDLQVQESVQLVFDQFERLGSVGKVMRYLRDQQVQLPRQGKFGIQWVRSSYQVIYQFLKLPAYAGAYAYGKNKRTHVPGKTGTVVIEKRALADWPVLIKDAFPAYITWEQFLSNQDTLRNNAQGASWTHGAPRNGAALLQGIVSCARCGRPMHVHYTHSPAYICDFETRAYGGRRCQNFTLAHIDPLISQLVLQAVQPARLEAALAALELLAGQRQALI
jgi:DNA invertase Pin-like site-specific DNA recombinase